MRAPWQWVSVDPAIIARENGSGATTLVREYVNPRLNALTVALKNVDIWPMLDGEVGVKDPIYYYGDVRRYGAKGDGVKDDQAAFQRACDSIAALGGGDVLVPKGTFLIGPGSGAVPPTAGDYSIQLGDGVTLRMDLDALLVKNFTSGVGAGSTDAMVRNADFVSGNARVAVIGGRLKATSSAHTGKLTSFWACTGVRVSGTRFEGVYEDWNTNFKDCDDVEIDNVFMDSGTLVFTDGLHFQGCQRVTVTNCDITCGDDCLALIEESNLATRDMSDVVVSNCYFYSKAGNGIRIKCTDDMTPSDRSIQRVAISNIVMKSDGGAGNPGLEIIDETRAGLISDVVLSNVVFDASANNAQMWIDGANRVTWDNVRILNPRDRLRIEFAEDIALINCSITGMRGTNQQCLNIGAAVDTVVTNVQVIGGQYTGATLQGILCGTAGTVTDVQFQNVTVSGATSDGIAVGATAAGVSVSGCRSKTNGGWGISVNASASSAQVTDNDVRGNTSGGISAAVTNTYRRGNRVSTGARTGRSALSNGTVTVSTAEVLASDNIQLTRVVGAGTTRGTLAVGTIVAGTSFVINSTDLAGTLSADDDSTVFWEIIH